MDEMVGKLLNIEKDEQTGAKQMMSNDDSFQNIHPATDGENDTPDKDLKKSSSNLDAVDVK